MLVLQAEEVRKALLPIDETIEAMKRAFASLSDGHAQVPLRARVQVPAHEGESLFMPAFVDDAEGEALAVKVVSVFPVTHSRDCRSYMLRCWCWRPALVVQLHCWKEGR
ncbi:MAG TPA: hypothetical protein VMW40_05255 [Candidatus Bathyarchaeia archaeon]|nr:hypothetical protein [Candidatus Bathyarchaeia archaeon]